MAETRRDDVEALVAKAVKEATGKRPPKMNQRWYGLVAVHTERGQAAGLLEAVKNTAHAGSNPRWSIIDDAVHQDNIFTFYASYAAKGANANDAEKLVRSVADSGMVNILGVAVETDGVVRPVA
jgi:hypothetical protein